MRGGPLDGAGVRWRLRSSLTHLRVRSLRCSAAAFAGTAQRPDSRFVERLGLAASADFGESGFEEGAFWGVGRELERAFVGCRGF